MKRSHGEILVELRGLDRRLVAVEKKQEQLLALASMGKGGLWVLLKLGTLIAAIAGIAVAIKWERGL